MGRWDKVDQFVELQRTNMQHHIGFVDTQLPLGHDLKILFLDPFFIAYELVRMQEDHNLEILTEFKKCIPVWAAIWRANLDRMSNYAKSGARASVRQGANELRAATAGVLIKPFGFRTWDEREADYIGSIRTTDRVPDRNRDNTAKDLGISPPKVTANYKRYETRRKTSPPRSRPCRQPQVCRRVAG